MPTSARIRSSGRKGRKSLDAALYAAASCFALAATAHAAGVPTGPSVVAGRASVSSPSSTSTVVTETSQKAIIDWQSFSIASGSNVQFVQPNASSIVLNRVVGSSPSEILGNLAANGQVWLINGNGVLFGHGSQIDVGGLIATTADIQNGDFLAGNYNFTSASANPNAGVVNQGTIRAADGGYVSLAGPTVANAGLISANLGTVVLAGARTFTVDFTGDNLLRFAIDSPVDTTPGGTGGSAQSGLVSNSGTISAAGGQITLTARAARNIVDNVISSTGVVDASSVSVRGGEVILDGGDGGVSVAGTVSASGSQGGSISVGGGSVALTDATLNATGAQGGGSITVGSQSAQAVTVDSHSTLDASARQSGNGGSISVVSQNTRFYGSANAKGGALSGDGGNIETSGNLLDVAGASIDTLAPHGRTGNWTLDPYDVTISNGSTSSGAFSSGTFTPSGDDSVVNVGDLQTALASTNVTITTGSGGSQTGDISVLSALTWSNPTTLTLDAYHSVNIDAPVTIAGAGGLILKTNDGGSGGGIIFQNGNVAFTDIIAGVPQGSLTINGDAYTLLGTMAAVQAINSGLTGNYALAVSLDASSVSNWVPIGTDGAGDVDNGGAGFTGVFEGLGNTISNLNVNIASNAYAGLFGYSGGTVRDIGLLGGSTTGGNNVGPLVGYNVGIVSGSWATGNADGNNYVGGLVGYSTDYVCPSGGHCTVAYDAEVDNSYATGSVNGVSAIGGLVGESWGLVSQSYATGNVAATNVEAGGLVGAIFFDGTIDESYATGAVSGSNYVGGLVGILGAANVDNSYATGAVNGSGWVGGLAGWVENNSTVNGSYSTGAVSGNTNVGGLIGENDATVSNSYWDMDTSGQFSSSGGTGLSTSQFQSGSLPTGFDSTVWNTGSGLYPYLNWQFPSGTPQAISGFAYSDAGFTPLASNSSGAVTVSALADGAGLGSATTGANGYYYLLAAPGTLSGTQQVLTYLNGDAVTANTYLQSPSGNVSNADLYGGYLRILSGADTASAMFSGLQTALGNSTGSNFLFTSGSLVSGASLDVESTNANGLAIDTALDVGDATLILDAAGPVTQSAAISTANLELLGNNASYALTDSDNSIGMLAANSGTISLTDASSLTIGSVNATTGVTSSGSVTLAATGDLSIASGALVTASNGDNVVLSATGNFINDEGSDAINVSGDATWLVYSNAPGSDTFGDLDSANTAIWGSTLATLPPGDVTQGGNRYIFAYQPTLTFTSTNDSKTYGTDDTETVAGDYTISGLQTGVANAYLGDTNADVFSGTPSITSAGSPASASVSGSPYAIAVSAGSVSVLDGYALAFDSAGQLTINKATLTIDATSDTKTYDGTTDSSATPTYSGLAASDAGDLTGLTQAYASPNVLGTNGSTLNVTNYSLSDPGNYNVVENSASGTISKATLTIDATSDTKTYDGTTASSATPTFTGLAGSDSDNLTGLSQAYASPNFLGTNGSTLNVTGYSLSDPGNYNVVENSAAGTINKATLTIDATTDTKTYDGTTVSSATPTYTGLAAADLDNLTGLSQASCVAECDGDQRQHVERHQLQPQRSGQLQCGREQCVGHDQQGDTDDRCNIGHQDV